MALLYFPRVIGCWTKLIVFCRDEVIDYCEHAIYSASPGEGLGCRLGIDAEKNVLEAWDEARN